jgi:hypothetical protein
MKIKYLLIMLLCLASALQAGYMDTDGYWVLEDHELAAWNGATSSGVTLNVNLDQWSSTNMPNTTSQWWMQFNPTNVSLLPTEVSGPGIKGWKLTMTNTGTAQYTIILAASTPYNGWWQTGTGVGVEPGQTKTAYIDVNDNRAIPDVKYLANLIIIFQSGSKMDFVFNALSAHRYAYDPIPFHNTEPDPTDLTELSWKNPANTVLNNVYFGTTEPNAADPNETWRNTLTLAAAIENPTETQSLAVSMLPAEFLPLTDGTTYYWIVDGHDVPVIETEPNFPGQVWKFTAVVNDPPAVELGAPTQYHWLGETGTPGQISVVLNPVVTDDGKPVPAALTYTWTKPAGARIDDLVFPFDTTSLTLPFDRRGLYTIDLAVSDGKLTTHDTVQFIIGNDACDAYRVSPGAAWFNAGDIDQNCLVDFADLQTLAAEWLDCADFLTNCQ